MKNRGFTLLMAIITTSLLLVVSFSVVNVALKQLLISNASEESQYAFYAADSGAECAVYWDLHDSTRSEFATSTTGSISCNSQAVTSGSQTVPTVPSQSSVIGGGGGGGVPTNYALSGTATVSSVYSAGYAASGAINGDRNGLNWGSSGGWNDGDFNIFPDWLQVHFTSSQTINEIDVFSVQDNYNSPSTPTPSMTFTSYGLTHFHAQYSTDNGSNWTSVPGGDILGNNLVWKQISFTAIPNVTDIRILINAAADGYSRITEVEAWGNAGGGGGGAPSIFKVDFPKGCAIVTVEKEYIGQTLETTINSKGYNTCDTGALRRYERGITLTY